MMAWAIFKQDVHWSRPKCRFGFFAKAKPEPQQFPHDFIEYAVSKGWAVKAMPPKREGAAGIKANKSRPPIGGLFTT